MSTTPSETGAGQPGLPPPRILAHVKHQLATLEVLVRARETDHRFGGHGRYEAEAYLTHRDRLDQAWQRLIEFEKLCATQGVDHHCVYATVGTPPQLSAVALAWLESRSVIATPK